MEDNLQKIIAAFKLTVAECRSFTTFNFTVVTSTLKEDLNLYAYTYIDGKSGCDSYFNLKKRVFLFKKTQYYLEFDILIHNITKELYTELRTLVDLKNTSLAVNRDVDEYELAAKKLDIILKTNKK